ncbi:TPA: phage tail protein [Escherichia coli]|uniref:phage tail protein n=1 Tax=Escherichia coli TaxID=562 RepID=UPI00209B6E56|nr:tail fiber protein [Escherichia coli]MCO7850621.1 tail fiber protein [Escherichia coli]MCO7865763.1 tail fiber protein [Escherichia coli]
MGADKTNNIMTLSSGVSQPLLADVQYFELYSSLALNRKLKNIVLPGFYCGFEPVPGTGLSVRITSENSEGKGAASVDVNNVQISVQQIEDVTVSVKAGATNIIVLEANFEHGVKTTQVDSASSVSAARIYARTDNTIGQNQIELCRVIVPSGATAVTKEMIVLKYRVNRAVGVEFSNEISSTEERKAATPLAVKTLHDLVDTKAPINSPNLTGTPTAPTATKGTNNTQIASTAFVMAAIAELVDSSPDALNTLNELAAALGNDPNFSATVTRLIGEKVAKDGDTMTGKLNLPQTSAFGINTNNRLGGNSLTLGDDDTGIKQEGDGALSVFANGQRVFLFTERSITSLKELLIGDARYSTGGDVYGSQWGDGWLSSWLSARFAECANASHNHPWSQITDVPAASLTQSGIVQLSSAINSSSETLAATPKAVKAAYDLANGKYTAQDATTAQKGIVQLSSATNSASETLAATPKAVKAAYDLANGKYTAQDATTARKGLVQLSSATNSTSETLAATPKAVKAVMDETNKKAPLNSPALTGTPTTPTAPQGTNNTQIASTAFVMAAIAALVDSSPDALNTLNELAAALGNDPNFATTMTNALAGKQSKDATLTALAELATSADKLPYFTGADRAALTALTSVGRAILGKTSTQGVLDYLGLGEGSALPVGVPVPWPLETPPAGWLKCNGAAFSSEMYPKLAKAYPTNKLPDLRGEFIRGWDDGRGLDAGRALLSLQDDSFEAHRHESFFYAGISRNEIPLKNLPSSDEMLTLSSTTNALSPDSIDATNSLIGHDDYNCLIEGNKNNKRTATGLSTSIVGTAETRPRNVAFNYIVRAA